jgi:23S rRNA (uracil1939-C5)-methyltransferase
MTDRRTHDTPAASFEQVNPLVAAALHAHVLERMLSYAPTTVVDAYAGAGATAIAIATTGARVTAIEVDREASAWAAKRLLPPSRVITGRVEEQIARALPADLVILNPPRTGVDAAVCAALEGVPRPRAIVYVSCNPATLARDVARLPSYRVASVQSFDMFPQTAHVESVCELVAEDS